METLTAPWTALVSLRSRVDGRIHAAVTNSRGEPGGATFCGIPVYAAYPALRMDLLAPVPPTCDHCRDLAAGWGRTPVREEGIVWPLPPGGLLLSVRCILGGE